MPTSTLTVNSRFSFGQDENLGAEKPNITGPNGESPTMRSMFIDHKGRVILKKAVAASLLVSVAFACTVAGLSGVATADNSQPKVANVHQSKEDENMDMAVRGSWCGYCEHSEPRWWSWWFGWGSCSCHAGWGGSCCNIPQLDKGECASYETVYELTQSHSVVPGIPFHVDQKTAGSGDWSLDALGQALAPVIVNMLYIDLDEQPPQHVIDSLAKINKATEDNSYWNVLKETFQMFYDILTDDRIVEYEMLKNLYECEGILSSFIKDSTGLTALSTMANCYEEEMDYLDAKMEEECSEANGGADKEQCKDGVYRPTLPEYHNFWRLIDVEDSVLFAMVDDKDDVVPKAWMRDDAFFGWLRFVGSNPDMIRKAVASDISASFAITDDMYNTEMGESGTGNLDAAMRAGRLFMLDFGLFGEGVQSNNGKTLFAPKVLFAEPINNEHMRTIAIQQYQSATAAHPLLAAPTPGKRDWDNATLTDAERKHLVQWAMAKTSVQVAESSYFEVVTHFGKTHLVMEPFMIATSQALHETHPIKKLLSPHMEGTVHINQGAVDSLIAADGVIDHIFPPPIEVTQYFAANAALEFLEDINNNFLPETFINRGTASFPTTYPFRDDAMLVWNEIESFTSKYLAETYSSDYKMREDPWLKCWWDFLVTNSKGKLKNAGDAGDNKLRTRAYLSKFLTMIIWTSTGQHAATNFPQKDVGAHVTMNPTSSWTDGALNKADLSITDWMAMLPPLHESLDQLNTEYLLGSVHYNKLGYYDSFTKSQWFDGEYRKLELEFQGRLDVITDIMKNRNNVVGSLRKEMHPYEILYADKMPNSINI